MIPSKSMIIGPTSGGPSLEAGGPFHTSRSILYFSVQDRSNTRLMVAGNGPPSSKVLNSTQSTVTSEISHVTACRTFCRGVPLTAADP